MSYQVVDAAGRTLTLDDDEPVPNGCSLKVPAMFMDAAHRQLFDHMQQDDADDVSASGDDDGDDEEQQDADAVADEQRQRASAAYFDMKHRVARSMHRHRLGDVAVVGDDGEELDRRALAYDAMKKRLGTPKARRARKPVEHHGWQV